MYIEENLDLSHLEVQNIVKEVDSYDNISKEYGISKDQVYLIKSHFRRWYNDMESNTQKKAQWKEV